MFLLYVLLQIWSVLGLDDIGLRIVNGSDAYYNEFPFMVSIHNNSQHICGGTILNERYILTAAHCVCQVRITNLELVITYSLSSSNRTVLVAKEVICGPYSTLEHRHDIAVIQLNSTIPTKTYSPVKLVSEDFNTTKSAEGTLVGWGLNRTGGSPFNILQKVSVMVYNDSICRNSYLGIYDMEYNMCAGWPQNGRGSCQGDSGGPLLVGGQQAGIISFGAPGDCGISDTTRPKILTRISKYLDWIKNNTKTVQGGNMGCSYHAQLHILCLLLFLSIIINPSVF